MMHRDGKLITTEAEQDAAADAFAAEMLLWKVLRRGDLHYSVRQKFPEPDFTVTPVPVECSIQLFGEGQRHHADAVKEMEVYRVAAALVAALEAAARVRLNADLELANSGIAGALYNDIPEADEGFFKRAKLILPEQQK